MSVILRLKAFALCVATMAVFFTPILIILIFDWLGIYSDIALVVTSVIVIVILLAILLKIALKQRKEVLKEEQETEIGNNKE